MPGPRDSPGGGPEPQASSKGAKKKYQELISGSWLRSKKKKQGQAKGGQVRERGVSVIVY